MAREQKTVWSSKDSKGKLDIEGRFAKLLKSMRESKKDQRSCKSKRDFQGNQGHR